MTLLKDNNYKEINIALLSLEADIKKLSNNSNFNTDDFDAQLADINKRIDEINGIDETVVKNLKNDVIAINSDIDNIENDISTINTNIGNIEQQLSNIFTAENKVTDFNTTTNSGIYYWVNDAANKPSDYGVLLVNKYSTWINQIAYGTNGRIYFRQKINDGNWTEWKAIAFDGEGNANTAKKASFLDEYVGAGGTRLTSGNIVPKDSSEYGGMRKDVVTSSMTDSGRPGQDGHLLTMLWDNSGRYDSQLYISNDGNHPGVKVRYKSNKTDYGPWTDIITSNNIGSQTVASAGKADTDANGNNIVNTYATKTELEKTTTKSVSLSTVTTNTTKYIKLGTFRWNDSFSFRCKIAGNGLEDNVNVNILGGISNASSVCGYYSTNSMLTKSIIVKRGEAWNGNFEIYLKIVQLTTANITVTIEKVYQYRINISESTTAPTGTLEEIAFNKINGMFSSNIDAKSLVLKSNAAVELNTFGNEPLSIGTINGTNIGIDTNEIQARNNGAASQLNLNKNGGAVKIGANRNFIICNEAKLTLQGGTVNSNSYTDVNPKLEFKNVDGSQNISLTFTDYDAVQAPASLTLNGNKGNEYFIAPCIKVNNVMKIPTSAPSTKENGCIWIG